MYSSEYIAWLVLLVLPAAQGYGSGAPNGMCYSSNMQPMHYLPYDPKPNARNGLAYPQTTDSPYSLTLEDGATTYAPGQTLKGEIHCSLNYHNTVVLQRLILLIDT